MLVDDTPISKRVHNEEELIAILKECHVEQEKCLTYFPAYTLDLHILLGMRRGRSATNAMVRCQ